MPENRDVKPSDNYVSKLNALLPAEVTGLYLFIRTLANNNRELDLYLGSFAVAIAVMIFLLGPTILLISDRISRALYSFTFILWVCSIEISIIEFRTNWEPVVFVVTGFIAIWTFALPYIFDLLKRRNAPGP